MDASSLRPRREGLEPSAPVTLDAGARNRPWKAAPALSPPRAPEASDPTLTRQELLDDLELHLHHRHHHELRDALARLIVYGALPRFQQDTISGPW